MKNINYIWTKKVEDDARTKGLEPRRAGTAKGYVTPLTIEQQIINHYMQFVTDVETYYYDINGNRWGLYNITEKLSDDGNRRVINFDYLREWTQDNINELVAECIRMREMDITHQGEAVTAC